MIFFRANVESKDGNSKNINEKAFKEQLSIILFSNLWCFKTLKYKVIDRLMLQYFESNPSLVVTYVNVDYEHAGHSLW